MPYTNEDRKRERQPHLYPESGKGWHKPEPKETINSVKQKIDELQAELNALQKKHDQMIAEAKLEVLVQIRNMMRAYDVAVEDVAPKVRKKRTQKAG